jgi:hypothetical protein
MPAADRTVTMRKDAELVLSYCYAVGLGCAMGSELERMEADKRLGRARMAPTSTPFRIWAGTRRIRTLLRGLSPAAEFVRLYSAALERPILQEISRAARRHDRENPDAKLMKASYHRAIDEAHTRAFIEVLKLIALEGMGRREACRRAEERLAKEEGRTLKDVPQDRFWKQWRDTKGKLERRAGFDLVELAENLRGLHNRSRRILRQQSLIPRIRPRSNVGHFLVNGTRSRIPAQLSILRF